MVKYPYLWILPALSLGLVLLAVSRGGVVGGASEGAQPPQADASALAERSRYLSRTLDAACTERELLGRHVSILHDELRELRGAISMHASERQLWRASYDELAIQFAQLSELALPTMDEAARAPRPVEAVFVR